MRNSSKIKLERLLIHWPIQWWIQDFPYGGANSQRGWANLLFGQLFAEKCMKMKKFGPGGSASPAPPPLRSTNAIHCEHSRFFFTLSKSDRNKMLFWELSQLPSLQVNTYLGVSAQTKLVCPNCVAESVGPTESKVWIGNFNGYKQFCKMSTPLLLTSHWNFRHWPRRRIYQWQTEQGSGGST